MNDRRRCGLEEPQGSFEIFVRAASRISTAHVKKPVPVGVDIFSPIEMRAVLMLCDKSALGVHSREWPTRHESIRPLQEEPCDEP